MKNLTILFVFTLLSSTVQSQSITEKEITGTWQVVNIVDGGTHPNQAKEMIAAYFDFYPDGKFQLRMKRYDRPSQEYENTFNNYKWSFNVVTQTIELSNAKMNIKTLKSNGKMFFELLDTRITLEVIMPM